MEGDEFVDVVNVSVYVVSKDYAWVTADADAETDLAKSVGRYEDLWLFGFVDVWVLEWWVMYLMWSVVDYVMVENSVVARAADAFVFEAEFANAMEVFGWDGEGEGEGEGGEGD